MVLEADRRTEWPRQVVNWARSFPLMSVQASIIRPFTIFSADTGACREAHRERFRRHLEAASREPLLRHDKLLHELANVTSLDWSETQRTLLFSRYAGSAIRLLQR
jgi:hypothetical protein